MGKGADTRTRIIETAARVFNTHGYHGGSLSELMARTGLKKGGIYNHFSSKEELAAAAFDHVVGRLMEAVNDAVRPHKTPLARMDAMLEFYRQYALHPPVPGGCAIMNTLIEAEETNPSLKARARAALEVLLNRLTGLIQQGMDQGEFHPRGDAKSTAAVIAAMIEGGILLSRAFEEATPMEQVIGQVRILLHAGIPH